MAIRVTSLLMTSPVSLPAPANYSLRPRETKHFPYVEYDKFVNDRRIADYLRKKVIYIENLDEAAAGNFVSQWNQEPKLRLQPYVLWVDSLGFLRMKSSDPTFDLDGVVIGPGGGGPVPPHGSTHTFLGTDPIPRIEVLEGSWTCTVAEQVGDVVFEAAANFARQANASSSATMPVIGAIIQKPTATTCVIARSGEVALYAGLVVGDEYFVSTVAGQLTNTLPVGSGQVVQYVGYARNTSTIVVQPRHPTTRA